MDTAAAFNDVSTASVTSAADAGVNIPLDRDSTLMGLLTCSTSSSPSTSSTSSVRQKLLDTQSSNEFLKKEEMEDGVKFKILKVEKIGTRFGEKLMGKLMVNGRMRKLILPSIFTLTEKEIMMYNYGGDEVYVFKKNNLIKIDSKSDYCFSIFSGSVADANIEVVSI
ncbi:uncharacterized protein LOC124161425 [Ischnura elegans]|uniref:uncharacterized protein LOC124161425 n=1 Tax=Ischnura elegans TaxID=197161 RepID=UPI001ED8A77E|nr:uncharacterized protein LOC124161425 [Ischnura elegans]